MEWLATMNGYNLTKYAPNIAKAKCRFFGVKDWQRCPCDPDSDRACISAHCHQDIKTDGHCHCNAYEPMEICDNDSRRID